MYPSDFDSDTPNDAPQRTWLTRFLASCLLIVMLCGIVATPLTIAIRYLEDRREVQAPDAAIATPTPRVNRIAYLSEDGQLITISPDGSDRRHVTAEGDSYQFFVWSPDGERIAAIGQTGLVLLHDSDGAESANQFEILYESDDHQPFYAYWSPVGDEITFLTNHEDGLALHIASGGERAASRVLDVGQPYYWAWNPDGDKLLIHAGFTGADARLSFIDLASDTVGVNIDVPGPFQAPGVSADGKFLAYSRSGPAGIEMILQEADGEVKIVGQSSGSMALSLSPTASQVAYISSDGQNPSFIGPLRIADFNSGESIEIVGDDVWAFFWSPDGRFIAYFVPALENDDVIQAAYQLQTRRTVSKPASQRQGFRLELRIYDLATGESKWLASFSPTRLFLTQFLPFFDQYALSHRIWSPASDALVLPISEENGPYIYVVPINGQEPRRLAVGEFAFWTWQ